MMDEDEYSDEYITDVNKTYSEMCSKKQVMPVIVAELASENDVILDFGAGKKAYGAAYLRGQRFKNVYAYEIGDNFVPGVHDSDAMNVQYTVIFANNVLNVQPSTLEVINLLMKIQSLLSRGGKFVCNYPVNPRKSDMSVEFLESLLRVAFTGGVSRVKKAGYNTPMWVCRYE